MKYLLMHLQKYGRARNKVGVAAHQREAYVMGYPKTGNTWLRVMLGKYVQLFVERDEKLPLPLFDQFEDIDSRVPMIQFTHGFLEWVSQTASDLTLENVVLPYRRSQVVVLARSIPDVLVSLYWQEKTRSRPPYSGTISDFIRDPVMGVEKAIAFYRLWYEGRDMVRGSLLLRYEDLRYSTSSEFRKLLNFFQIPLNEQYLTDAIAYSNFDNMRQLELKNIQSSELVYRSSGYSIFGTGNVEKSDEAFHVRKGQVGGFREYLSEADVEFLRQAMKGQVPEWYGYDDGFWKDDRS